MRVPLNGLASGRAYFYRFTGRTAVSPVGRTPHQTPHRLRADWKIIAQSTRLNATGVASAGAGRERSISIDCWGGYLRER